jgi:hypothetical protein
MTNPNDQDILKIITELREQQELQLKMITDIRLRQELDKQYFLKIFANFKTKLRDVRDDTAYKPYKELSRNNPKS